jgi:undecaprenyl-diphosphatase
MGSWVEFLDITLFRLINQAGQNYFLDWFMPFMSDLKNFTYILVLLGGYIVWREGKGGLIFLVFVGLTLAITDPFSGRLLKEWVGRVRPCQALGEVRLLTDCNPSYSFPSSHAVNIFAGAYFLSQMFRRLAPLTFAIAAVVAYSRIYIGVHYPLDVIGGAAIGLLIAWPMSRLKDMTLARLNLSPPKDGER